MTKAQVHILFIGDIIGRYGREITKFALPQLWAEERIDFVVANGENSASGNGITEKVYAELINMGIDVLTMGNHVFDKKEFLPKIDECSKMVRPANYPANVPGQDNLVIEKSGIKIGVFNLCGRVFMPALDCPFKKSDQLVEEIKQQTKIILVDMHAEATSEKQAIGTYLDGMVSAVVGTHTHIQTADERILPGGTAFIADVGMVGSEDSIIGMEKEPILRKYLTQMPHKYDVAQTGTALFNAALISIDRQTGKATHIKRIMKRFAQEEVKSTKG